MSKWRFDILDVPGGRGLQKKIRKIFEKTLKNSEPRILCFYFTFFLNNKQNSLIFLLFGMKYFDQNVKFLATLDFMCPRCSKQEMFIM